MNNKAEYAAELFKKGYNCSQAVLCAFCEELDMSHETALKLAASFGGGMGRLREVCGAVSGMFMVAGLKYGYTDVGDKALKQKHYELIQMLSKRFKEINGSIVCRELLGLDIKHDNPVPEERTDQYYKKRPCAEMVKCAAEIIDEVIREREADSTSYESIDDLPREKLLELNKIYAKNWLAHDGLWFQSIEKKYGMEMAIDMDREAWRSFTVIEARRLIEFLQLGKNSGIEGLKKALRFRLYSSLNEDEIITEASNVLVYRVKTCRVQHARRKKGMSDFPCKSVGVVEYGLFAETIDEHFETEAVSCHPDVTDCEYNCIWKFTLKDK